MTEETMMGVMAEYTQLMANFKEVHMQVNQMRKTKKDMGTLDGKKKELKELENKEVQITRAIADRKKKVETHEKYRELHPACQKLNKEVQYETKLKKDLVAQKEETRRVELEVVRTQEQLRTLQQASAGQV